MNGAHVGLPMTTILGLRGTGMGDWERIGGVGVVLGHAWALTRNVVQVAGRAARLPVAELEAALARSPAVRALCLSYVAALLFQVMQSSARNALHPTEQRLCRWSLLHDRAGG